MTQYSTRDLWKVDELIKVTNCLSKHCQAHKKCSKKVIITLLIKLSCFTIPALHVLLFYKFPQNEPNFLTPTLPDTIIFGI